MTVMCRKRSWFVRSAAVIAVLMVVLTMCGCAERIEKDGQEADGKITIVATVFPYYDFARAIAGEEAEVTLLLPPGRDSHSYEPSAYDLLHMQQADVLLYNGGEMESWVDSVLEALPRGDKPTFCGIEAITLLEEVHTKSMKSDSHHHEDAEISEEECDDHDHEHFGHHHEDEYDEHIWTSPANAILLVQAIADLLCAEYPEKEKSFTANAEVYIQELELVDQEIRSITEQVSLHKLIFADRFPFLYFAHEYDLDFDAAFSGCAGDTEPSAAVIASLIEEIEADGVGAVFYTENGSIKTAQMLQEVTGTQILQLHSCHTVSAEELKQGIRYVDLMRQNADNLKIGLK